MQAVIITTLSFCYDCQTVNTHVHAHTHRETLGEGREEGERETERQTGRQTGIEMVLTGERFLADSFYVPLSWLCTASYQCLSK